MAPLRDAFPRWTRSHRPAQRQYKGRVYATHLLRRKFAGIVRRFEAYCEEISEALEHADRRAPAQWYLKRLNFPGERKSVEPMAAWVYPDNVRSAHQSMHHLVAAAGWSDRAVLAATSGGWCPSC